LNGHAGLSGGVSCWLDLEGATFMGLLRFKTLGVLDIVGLWGFDIEIRAGKIMKERSNDYEKVGDWVILMNICSFLYPSAQH
jgi:hypothetical protein